MSKLSVIVTIYNREEYLERCVDSIINQTYKDLEIILVDDGSTDSSYAIMERYAASDSRVKIYHKENGGVVSCWKYGVSKVTSPYLTMVDSDDWIELDAYEKMMSKAIEHDVDMVIGDMRYSTDTEYHSSISFDGLYDEHNIHEIYPKVYNRRSDDYLSVSRCIKVCKTDFFKTSLEYDYNDNLLEDLVYVLPLYFKAKSIYFLNEPLYIYFDNQNSMTNVKHTKGDFRRYNKVYEYIIKTGIDKPEYGADKYDIMGNFLYIKIAQLLFSTLTRKEKIAELKEMMALPYTHEVIDKYKHIGMEKMCLKILLKLRLYWLIVRIKGTK